MWSLAIPFTRSRADVTYGGGKVFRFHPRYFGCHSFPPKLSGQKVLEEKVDFQIFTKEFILLCIQFRVGHNSHVFCNPTATQKCNKYFRKEEETFSTWLVGKFHSTGRIKSRQKSLLLDFNER